MTYMYLIVCCLMYPVWYDGTQMFKQGHHYLKYSANYIDIFHILFGFFNIYMQVVVGTWNIYSKYVMITVIATCLVKTFYFMRIVMRLSYIVTMIVNVVKDLVVFLTFYIILVLMFSMIFDVISRNTAKEYRKLSWFFGNIFATMRLSLGDFHFGMIDDKPLTKQHILFWSVWVIMVVFSALIFLNFIIAEVSSSYQKVSRNIDSLIYKERAGLIMEAEDITPDKTKLNNKIKFPQYIVIRSMEE